MVFAHITKITIYSYSSSKNNKHFYKKEIIIDDDGSKIYIFFFLLNDDDDVDHRHEPNRKMMIQFNFVRVQHI